MAMKIAVDDLSGPEIAAFLQEHLDEMRATTPPESKHALDLDALRRPEVTFWTVYEGDELLGCGALKELDGATGEIKSMRTAAAPQRRGGAGGRLGHLGAQARGRGYERLYLETGSFEFFAPARALYEKFGFTYCGPFADYKLDPNSAYMVKVL